MWDRAESNRRHMDFQSIALPTELQSQHAKDLGQAKRLPKEESQIYDFVPNQQLGGEFHVYKAQLKDSLATII